VELEPTDVGRRGLVLEHCLWLRVDCYAAGTNRFAPAAEAMGGFAAAEFPRLRETTIAMNKADVTLGGREYPHLRCGYGSAIRVRRTQRCTPQCARSIPTAERPSTSTLSHLKGQTAAASSTPRRSTIGRRQRMMPPPGISTLQTRVGQNSRGLDPNAGRLVNPLKRTISGEVETT